MTEDLFNQESSNDSENAKFILKIFDVPDLAFNVFSFLSFRTIYSLLQVNKQFHDVVIKNQNFWATVWYSGPAHCHQLPNFESEKYENLPEEQRMFEACKLCIPNTCCICHKEYKRCCYNRKLCESCEKKEGVLIDEGELLTLTGVKDAKMCLPYYTKKARKYIHAFNRRVQEQGGSALRAVKFKNQYNKKLVLLGLSKLEKPDIYFKIHKQTCPDEKRPKFESEGEYEEYLKDLAKYRSETGDFPILKKRRPKPSNTRWNTHNGVPYQWYYGRDRYDNEDFEGVTVEEYEKQWADCCASFEE